MKGSYTISLHEAVEILREGVEKRLGIQIEELKVKSYNQEPILIVYDYPNHAAGKEHPKHFVETHDMRHYSRPDHRLLPPIKTP